MTNGADDMCLCASGGVTQQVLQQPTTNMTSPELLALTSYGPPQIPEQTCIPCLNALQPDLATPLPAHCSMLSAAASALAPVLGHQHAAAAAATSAFRAARRTCLCRGVNGPAVGAGAATMSVRSVTGQALQYDTPGNPADVLCLREFQLGEPTGGQVQVRFLQVRAAMPRAVLCAVVGQRRRSHAQSEVGTPGGRASPACCTSVYTVTQHAVAGALKRLGIRPPDHCMPETRRLLACMPAL